MDPSKPPIPDQSRPRALEWAHPRSLLALADKLQTLLKRKLWLQIIVGMLVGIGLGILLGPELNLVPRQTAQVIGEWVAFPGYLFLATIQMIVVPLVFASVVRGIASNENIDQLPATGLRLVGYFLFTTSVAVVIGLGTGLWLRPGERIQADVAADLPAPAAVEDELSGAGEEVLSWQTIPGQLIDLLPSNALSAMSNSEMLQIVIFALVFGLALVSMAPGSAKPMLDFLGSLEAICMTIVRWVMVLAPIAVMGLIAKVTMSTGWAILQSLGLYVGTVLIGFAGLLVFYLLIVTLWARRQPWRFLGQIKEAMLMAFSTNSSAATMPISLKVAEQKLNIRPSTARFVIPIGATVNMDASALYQGLATLFIAQLYDIDLPLSGLLVLLLTVVGASIGTPATPGVGIIILSSVLTSVGIPLEGLTLIIGVDRILELFRSSLNVTGDLVCCAVMDRSVPLSISREDEQARQAQRDELRAQTGEDTVLAGA